MTKDGNIFTLRFFGNDISPDSFTIKELGQLLVSIEDGVKAIIECSYPAEDSESANLSLSSIKNESNSLGLRSANQVAKTGIFDFASSIKQNKVTNLPKKAYESYKQISTISQNKKCSVELLYNGDQLYLVNPDTEIVKQENVIVEIDSIIYGDLIKLGCSNTESTKSRIWIDLLEGGIISFNVTKEQAVDLSSSLFKTVGLKGKIKWNVLTKTTVGFIYTEIIKFKRGNASKAFEELRNLTDGFWDTLNTDKEITNYLKGD